MNKLKPAILIFIFSLSSVYIIEATPPPDTIMAPIKQVINILQDPDYQKSGHKYLQGQKIKKVIRNHFDFTPFSRHILGKYWKTLTTKQKHEFTAAFSEFLGCVYIPKVLKGYKGQKVYFNDMEVKLNTVAWVKIKIEDSPNPIFLTFNMVNHDGSWKVYDVRIDGDSLAAKYRKPFWVALTKESPQRLIYWLKKRVEEQKRSGQCPKP